MEPLTGRRRALVLAACMAAMSMSAVEATIVATAMPTIVARLGGFALFGWVFVAYLLTQAVTIPIYGRFADLFGRKPVFFVGAAIFLAGSTLCGFAHSMMALVVFRAVQGLGAGAILPVSQTIVGDIYAPADRARIQGLLSSVWGVSAIIGPLLGAAIVGHLGWPLIFWINLPVGAAAIAMLAAFLRESPEKRPHAIDFPGAALLVISAGGLMLAMLQAVSLGWWAAALLAVSIACGIGLFQHERRAAEPLLPLSLWRDRTILAGNLGGLAIGATMMGVSAFLPPYVQGVMDRSAFFAGVCIALLSIGWSAASPLAGRLMLATTYRTVAIAGGVLLAGGSGLLLRLAPDVGMAWPVAGALAIGAGMGLCNTTFLVSVQNAAGWSMRGIATSSTVFMRMLGSALGTAILGSVLNLALTRRLPGAEDPVQVLMDPARRGALATAALQQVTSGVAGALHLVYWACLGLALAALALAWLTPAGERPGEVLDRPGATTGRNRPQA